MKKYPGADISTQLCGVKLKSPFIISSGPISYGARGIIDAFEAGAGAVVTKTIRKDVAVNPIPHISKIGSDSLINCEKWADIEAEAWIKKEIPTAKKAGVIVIASVGHTPPEVELYAREVEKAGADFIELVSYTEETMLPMIKIARQQVSIPIISKLTGNWPDPVATSKKCLEAGADAISAIDSIGPTLKIDIKKARPAMPSEDGYGWLSGAAIRPISLRINSEIARSGCQELVGIGGVSCAEDAVEMLMVGTSAVGICSVVILNGLKVIGELNRDLSILLEQLGYGSIPEVKGVALSNFPTQEVYTELEFSYEPDAAPCQEACPAHVDVPLYIDHIRRGRYLEAYKIMSNDNPFPAICGRVCEHPCETQCRRNNTDEALQVRLLKRTAADETFAACGDKLPLPAMSSPNGKKVAIIGSGPAGLTAAYFLARWGYQVSVFESQPVAGGMLAVGIPDYRLPKDILGEEINRIRRMGVKIRTGMVFGQDLTLEQLQDEGFASVLFTIGTHEDRQLSLAGEELEGVESSIEFLRLVNLGRLEGLHGERIAVIGGGNAALDAARTALRLGAEKVTILYRRQEEDMPALKEEVAQAREEGVEFLFLKAPSRFAGDGQIEKLYFQEVELGDYDDSGRRKPVLTGKETGFLEVHRVICALGQKVETEMEPVLKECCKNPHVFAAGDCVTGPTSVIDAIARGKEAAQEIDLFLEGTGELETLKDYPRLHFVNVARDQTTRQKGKTLPSCERIPGFAEVELGLEEDQARQEAQRCLHCGCINCLRCVYACSYGARTLDYPHMQVDEDLCRHCGLCVSVCPTEALGATYKQDE